MAKHSAPPAKPRPPATTPVRRKPTLDFSVTGLVYCSMMMFMGLAAINSQANLLFGVFGLMIGILLVSWFISKLVLRRLTIRRTMPEIAVVGQPTTVTYEFNNAKRFWPSLSVSLAELDGTEAFTRQPVAYMLHAAPKMTAVVPIEVLPKRRGVYELDRYQISTSFPFGFIKRAVERRQKDIILVYPPIGRVDPQLLAMARSVETTGAMMRPRRGGMDEFYGVKEHRAGENPRWIYWKRSARTPGQLVAKEMTQVSPPRLVLLVDTYLADRSPDSHASVERIIAMAASLGSQALEAGLSVGLAAWNDGWLSVPANRGKRHRRDVLAHLARLPLNVNPDHGPQALLDASRELVKSGNTPLLLTPGEMRVSLGEHLRSGMIVIQAGSPQADRWFTFDSDPDFGRCMPADQQPDEGKEGKDEGGKRKNEHGAKPKPRAKVKAEAERQPV